MTKPEIVAKVSGIIDELEKTVGRVIPLVDIKRAANEKGIPDISSAIETLKEEGLIFEPKRDFISKLS
jgi:hypothetical protein